MKIKLLIPFFLLTLNAQAQPPVFHFAVNADNSTVNTLSTVNNTGK